ncbi:helix-turn-helix transcriptional regulator [Xenorhabdus sp. Reich]|uniref:Helix-turn-helix transcriptional regulator n=1 Tax=Xenorhabdus littoralis TaxID=2582835 RepID=A0ABU4SIA5_9GAMM|nr:helix-turn-helix transcriptional regulator [Xenorhabdus sp. Reich]
MNESGKKTRRSVGSVRSEEAHKAILEAAKSLLAERGYAGFSIEAVAKRGPAE